jgi:hypothetical protein
MDAVSVCIRSRMERAEERAKEKAKERKNTIGWKSVRVSQLTARLGKFTLQYGLFSSRSPASPLQKTVYGLSITPIAQATFPNGPLHSFARSPTHANYPAIPASGLRPLSLSALLSFATFLALDEGRGHDI